MYIADFHIHSKYSRATSRNMEIDSLSLWAKNKGVSLLGTGDITHPLWFAELRSKIKETDKYGIYKYNDIDFILTGEVNNIYPKHGFTRKIHNILFFSTLAKAEKFNKSIGKYAELLSDGRPILQIDSKILVKMVKDADEYGFVVPAHIWTPHFSLFGANSGFDSIEECFEEEINNVLGLETGLSSDPPMNWKLSQIDKFTLISNSDAHSPQKIAREANVFFSSFDFNELKEILKTQDKKKFLFTIEYFPEEGKYHYDGHRFCKICLSPEETIKNNYICPVCKKKITVGVLHRVIKLADRDENNVKAKKIPFKHLVPLDQIIAFVYKKDVNSVFVQNIYSQTIQKLGPEMHILLELSEKEIFQNLSEELANGIKMVKEGKVFVSPGYDGEFGKIEIRYDIPKDPVQQTLF
ncbi:MAG: endonuclease Q family protein [Candidatus Omnitrophica bacterium]|jgi:uncharacterized protein (TIGR00375 family)|nr:endonuclease Q family protein [Candidatus Omnitrophota bacterium]